MAATTHQQRVAKLQAQLSPTQAFLLSHPTDVTYFSGFQYLVPEEREAFFVVTKTDAFLIRASFSPVPEEHFYHVLDRCAPVALAEHLAKIAGTTGTEAQPGVQAQLPLTEMFFEPTSLYVEEHKQIREKIEKNGCKLTEFSRDQIWQLRTEKDDAEIAALKKAATVIASAIAKILSSELKVGVTEKQICAALEDELRSLGSQKPAFPTIVAFGPHSAEPHYQPGDTPLQENTAVLIDAGATIDNYRSDMTRTVWFGGEKDFEFTKVEKIVQDAYQAGFAYVKKGTANLAGQTDPQKQQQKLIASELDAAARAVITQADYGDAFIHTTGHGIGLDIHEPPSLNWNNHTELRPHMAITIEPGIYLTGRFGYRFENTILLTETGAEELTVV